MAEQHHHRNFSLADIERYLSGRMPAREMNELEKAALHDPFLADALEGYAQAPLALAHQHLNEITAALQQPGQVVALPPVSKRFPWLRVAAAVVVLAGIGFGAWLQYKPAKQATPTLAQTTVSPAPAIPVPAPKNDTISDATLAAVKPRPAPLFKKPAPLSIISKPQAAEPAITAFSDTAASHANTMALARRAPGLSVSAAAAPQQETPVTLAQVPSSLKADSTVMVMGYGTKKRNNLSAAIVQDKEITYTLHGRILDSQQKPLANATVKPVNGKALAMTDDAGNFTLHTTDSVAEVNIASLGYDGTATVLRAGKVTTVQLKETESSLGEMVITEMRSRKKKTATASTTDTAAHPSGGWQSFQEYVYHKLHKTVDTTAGRTFPADIELEFEVTDNGAPSNVKVLSNSAAQDANRAVDVLSNGPRWITGAPDRKKKVTVRLKNAEK